MSADVVTLPALLAEDPTLEENDESLATPHHRRVIDSLFYTLQERLADPGLVLGAEEARFYPDMRAVAARQFREPDLLVAPGRPEEERLVFLLSDEGRAPAFVLEALSETTFRNDLGEKRRRYRGIGVREYIVANLDGTFLGEPRLQRWRL